MLLDLPLGASWQDSVLDLFRSKHLIELAHVELVGRELWQELGLDILIQHVLYI